jgi:hypothetical protein
MAPAVFQVPPWRYCRLRVSSSTPSSRPSIVPGDFAGDAPDQEIRQPAGDGVAPCPAPTRLAVRRRPARAGREPASARRHPATRRAGRRVRRRLLLALLPRAQPPPQDQHQLVAPEVPWHRRRDRDTDTELAAAGWLAVRIWEHEGHWARQGIVSRGPRRRAPFNPGGQGVNHSSTALARGHLVARVAAGQASISQLGIDLDVAALSVTDLERGAVGIESGSQARSASARTVGDYWLVTADQASSTIWRRSDLRGFQPRSA